MTIAAEINAPVSSGKAVLRQWELVDKVRAYNPAADEALLNKAYVFSVQAHGKQLRHSGDPYYAHPIEVAGILTGLKMDTASVCTALLHDVLEDTPTTFGEMADMFGGEIARLVQGVTKLSQLELSGEVSKQAENFQKFVLAMSKDLRVLLVKLCDRLHNMRTLQYHPKPESRERIARETMEIYAPLARRIGVDKICSELEDLSFFYMNPSAYESITTRLNEWRESRAGVISQTSVMLRDLMDKHGIKAVAAHWAYKSGSYAFDPDSAKKAGGDPLSRIRSLVEIMEHGGDADEFLENAKLDLFTDQVFTFTPKGDLIALPRGATPIDFAYAVHTKVGDTCVGAIINRQQKPLRTRLQNGDVVKIIRGGTAEPQPGWENIVVTGRAKSALRRLTRDTEADEFRRVGEMLADHAFSREDKDFSDSIISDAIKRLPEQTTADRIVGIAGRGEGVTVHTIDCESLAAEEDNYDNWVDLGWRKSAADSVSVGRIMATIEHVPGALADITVKIGEAGGNLTNIKTLKRSPSFFDMVFDVEVLDTRHLSHIVAALRASSYVVVAKRARADIL